MARYNNRKINLSEQTLPISKALPGMIISFNYSEHGVVDPRPILLFLHHNRDRKLVEGLNINYINPTKIKKLFQVINFKKGKIEEHENLISLKDDYFRIQIANPKKRSPFTTTRFYNDVVKADDVFKKAYRSYKTSKLTSLKVTNIKLDMVGAIIPEKIEEEIYLDPVGRWRNVKTNRYAKAPDEN